jgi:hypothetical protein
MCPSGYNERAFVTRPAASSLPSLAKAGGAFSLRRSSPKVLLVYNVTSDRERGDGCGAT